MDQEQLARATESAARNLAARGAAIRAEGTTLSGTLAGGTRIILRNALQPTPAFAEAGLLSQIAHEIVQALISEQ